MRATLFIALLSAPLILSGCTPGSITPLPTTPEACLVDYNEGKKRLNSPNTYSGGNAGASILGMAIGRGIASGGLESRYNACLAQFGSNGVITDAQTYQAGKANTSSTASTQSREDYVPELDGGYSADGYSCGTSVFVGGSGYCIKGNR